jgi:hypothetical protein
VPSFAPPELVEKAAATVENPDRHDADDAPRRARAGRAHLPRHCRERDTCQHVAKLLHLAVRCDDINDAVIALRLMLQLHGCRACRNKTRPRKQP